MKPSSGITFSIFAWTLNICSSVGIIFANKFLMSQSHLGFSFSTTLTGAHFLCSACATLFLTKVGAVTPSGKSLSRRDLAWYIVYGSMSVIALNISLLVNDVGFYQLMKLTVVPYVALVEVIWRGKSYTWQQTAAMLCVVGGVGVVTVSGVEVGRGGVAYSNVRRRADCLFSYDELLHGYAAGGLTIGYRLFLNTTTRRTGLAQSQSVFYAQNRFLFKWQPALQYICANRMPLVRR